MVVFPTRTADGRLRRREAGRSQPLLALTASEFGERFAFSGLQALLVLYLGNSLHDASRVRRIAGLRELQQAVDATFHIQQPAQTASELYGLLTALFFLSTIVGGLIADRWIGQRLAVIAGGVVAAAGYFLLTIESCALAGLVLVMAGSGAFKANIAAQVSRLHDGPGDRRDRNLRVFFMGIFSGMMTAPLICGALGQDGRWSLAFAVAGLGMACGLGVYLGFAPTTNAAPPRRDTQAAKIGMTPRKFAAYGLFFAMLAISLIGAQQVHNAYIAWARTHVALTWAGRAIPTSWLLTLDALLVLAAVAATGPLWRLWGRLFPEPNSLQKIGLGCLVLAASYGCLAATEGREMPVVALLIVGFHALNGLACANLIPVALSFLSGCTPQASRSTFVGLLYLQYAAASILAGDLGRWLDVLSSPVFWGLHVALFTATGLAILLSARWIEDSLGETDSARARAAIRSPPVADRPTAGQSAAC